MGKWNWVPLGSVIKIEKNSVLPTDFAQDVYYVGLEDIEKGTGRILSTIKIASDVGLKSNKFKFTDQHVLYGKLRPNLNKVALPDFNGVCSTDIYPILPIISRIDRRFLCAVLRSTLFVDYVSNKVNGVNLPRVNEKVVSDFRIPLPPLPIQQKIADALDKASELIELRKAQIEKLDLLIKSQFVEMFGDPVTNPKGWEKTLLRTLITQANNGLSRRGSDSQGNIVLRLVELQDGYIDYSRPNRIVLASNEKKKFMLNNNDFLFARVNGNPEYVGRCAIFHEIPEDVYHNDHIIRVHFDESRLNGYYASTLINSKYGKIQMKHQIKTSAGQYTISQDGIGDIEVTIPPIEIQLQFAELVQRAEEQKSIYTQSLKLLEQNYNSILQKCFSGEMF